MCLLKDHRSMRVACGFTVVGMLDEAMVGGIRPSANVFLIVNALSVCMFSFGSSGERAG